MFFFPVDNEDSDDFKGYAVRDCFFEFNLTLMKNYKKFWVLFDTSRKFINIKIAKKPPLLTLQNLSF